MIPRATLLLAAALSVTACGIFGGGGSQPAPVRQPTLGAPGPSAAPPSSPGAVQPMNPADYRGPAAGAAAATPSANSLYARLGGLDAIRAVVHDLVGRLAADERINAFFRGVDIPQLERLLTEQICQATGGPCRYTGRTMQVTHQGMNLTDAHFNALVEDLSASLDQFNVPAREKTELLTALATMRGDIVGR